MVCLRCEGRGFYFLIHAKMDDFIISRDAEIQNYLLEKTESLDIAADVANAALQEGDPRVFLLDVLTYGCPSGMVRELIFY